MAKVEIYTTALCGFCYRAKRLLEAKGATFTEIDVTFRPGERARLAERAGSRNVPQIWIGERRACQKPMSQAHLPLVLVACLPQKVGARISGAEHETESKKISKKMAFCDQRHRFRGSPPLS